MANVSRRQWRRNQTTEERQQSVTQANIARAMYGQAATQAHGAGVLQNLQNQMTQQANVMVNPSEVEEAAIRTVENENIPLAKPIEETKDAFKKIRKMQEEDAVAHIVLHHSKNRADHLKKEIGEKGERLVVAEKSLKEDLKRTKTLISSKKLLEKKYTLLTKTSKRELIKEYKNAVLALKQESQITSFTIDTIGRIIITTLPLRVKKPTWRKEKEIGVFQIRIDLSAPSIDQGIRIINITKRFSHYDSPTINNGNPCWGNIGPDIENDFLTQDLKELVLDLIDYITSPNENHGFLTHKKAVPEDKKGWEQFLEHAKKHTTPLGFDTYDDVPYFSVRDLTNRLTSDAQLVSFAGTVTAPVYMGTSTSYIGTTGLGQVASDRSPEEERLKRFLVHIGFTFYAARYYSHSMFTHSQLQGVEIIECILQRHLNGSFLFTAVCQRASQARPMREGDPVIETPPLRIDHQRTIDREELTTQRASQLSAEGAGISHIHTPPILLSNHFFSLSHAVNQALEGPGTGLQEIPPEREVLPSLETLNPITEERRSE